MKRYSIPPRANWQAIVESQGFYFHTVKGEPYWDESAYYTFSMNEVDQLEEATQALYALCLETMGAVVQQGAYDRLHIPEHFASTIEQSWRNREPGVYGRFDLVYHGAHSTPKMLEFNADTPTSLLETSIIQYEWLLDQHPKADQFNSLHEQLIATWQGILLANQKANVFQHDKPVISNRLSLAYADHNLEDLGNVDYLRATAEAAGFDCQLIPIEAIGWDAQAQCFVDTENQPVERLFKLYPWEWLIQEPFGIHLTNTPLQIIEPAWKLLLSNKAILPLLWERYPNHPNLLPAYDKPNRFTGAFVKKPVFSREGANIEIMDKEQGSIASSFGSYGAQPTIYQAFLPLPQFEGNYTVIGSWIVGGKACGMGIREDSTLITRNTSRFLPHIITD